MRGRRGSPAARPRARRWPGLRRWLTALTAVAAFGGAAVISAAVLTGAAAPAPAAASPAAAATAAASPATAAPPAAALPATPRTSLTAIWNEVMCVSCHEPLSVAQSPQAYAERNYIRGLVSQGYTKAQIERALVAQYGPSVLGRPPAHGFNLTVYVLPPAILIAGIAILLVALPRWRRRARAAAAREPAAASPSITPADERRLEDELSHYPG